MPSYSEHVAVKQLKARFNDMNDKSFTAVLPTMHAVVVQRYKDPGCYYHVAVDKCARSSSVCRSCPIV